MQLVHLTNKIACKTVYRINSNLPNKLYLFGFMKPNQRQLCNRLAAAQKTHSYALRTRCTDISGTVFHDGNLCNTPDSELLKSFPFRSICAELKYYWLANKMACSNCANYQLVIERCIRTVAISSPFAFKWSDALNFDTIMKRTCVCVIL